MIQVAITISRLSPWACVSKAMDEFSCFEFLNLLCTWNCLSAASALVYNFQMVFKPRTNYDGNTFSVLSCSSGEIMASIELDDEQMEAAERDRLVELRIKFGVHGMHGRLFHIHPIIEDGKAKKLANSNWKTVQPIQFD